MIKKRHLFFVVLLALSGSEAKAEPPQHPLLKQAKTQCAQRLNYAKENNAQIELTSDGKSFCVLWLPEGASPAHPPPMIVTLHGHGSWAFDEFFLWHRTAREHGYGILAIQWWLGQGEKYQDYLIPREIYQAVDPILTREKIKPGTVLLHGFSRGSANSYAVAALDRNEGKHYFALIVANAGKPGLDFPPNRDIEEGRFGPMPLEGTHWVTFAGGRDPHPDRSGSEGMREAAEWIRQYGGVVDLAIEDKNSGHGGFHRDSHDMESAIEVFEKRLKETS